MDRSEPDNPTLFDGPNGEAIAYRFAPGHAPALVFLPGYMSDMAGGKATALFGHARRRGQACLLLDYSGCGQSRGDFADGTLSRWRADVLALIATCGLERVLLVGSSMGGWLALLVALALAPGRVTGLVGVAAAPDFTQWGFSPAQKAELVAGRTILEDNPYGPEPTPTHARFWVDGESNRLLGGEIALTCPVRLLHGQDDSVVPCEIALRLAERLRSDDVQVTLVKNGDHRLSREAEIALLLRTVSALSEPA